VLWALAGNQVSHNERINAAMITKDLKTKMGISRFPNTAQESIFKYFACKR
jgi:hypothetical protein